MKLPVDYHAFAAALQQPTPPDHWPESLKALWWDARENWERSHDIAQYITGPVGSRIHAYLHRKEGDDWNAGYWYRQAGLKFPKVSLDEERVQIVESILSGS